jgi:Lrp/AsnC family leucine-responsive transcriptional regulator
MVPNRSAPGNGRQARIFHFGLSIKRRLDEWPAEGKPCPVDALDWALVAEVQADARLSYSELARRVHMSAPAVAERMRRLEQSGVITGYHAAVDLAAAGWPVLAFIRMACYGPKCVLQDAHVAAWPQMLEIHRVTGPECSVLKVCAESMAGLEDLIDRLASYGTPSSTLVLSSPVSWNPVRAPEPLQAKPR